MWALKKTLRAISIPLGSSLAAIDGSDGLIRVYHSCGGWIDFFWSGVQQPEWKPLLEFIREVRQRFLRTTPSEILAVHLRNWIRSIEAIPLDALEARCPPRSAVGRLDSSDPEATYALIQPRDPDEVTVENREGSDIYFLVDRSDSAVVSGSNAFLPGEIPAFCSVGKSAEAKVMSREPGTGVRAFAVGSTGKKMGKNCRGPDRVRQRRSAA